MTDPQVTYAASRVEELLKCPVCLDRFNDPKILPCQHTFCLAPCLEGLLQNGSRLFKCPECRAEHIAPYNGPSAFPTNITISGFLDLPTQRDTPRENQNGGSVDAAPGKCRVCEQVAETLLCAHCEKQVCETCSRSHVGQVKLDIGRMVNQIRRKFPGVSNKIADVEQRSEQIKQRVESVKSEVRNTIERYIKELRDREIMLCSELETFMQGELRGVHIHQENMEVELASMASYCDSTEGLLNQTDNTAPGEDLVAMKRQCVDYMERLRDLENEEISASKQVRFSYEGATLHAAVANLGQLVVTSPGTSSGHGLSRASNDRSSTNENNRTRGRWSDAAPLNIPNTNGNRSPSPTVDFYSALFENGNDRSPRNQRLLNRPRDHIAPRTTLPSRQGPSRNDNYMFRMNPLPDGRDYNDMFRIANGMSVQTPRNRSNATSIFGRDSRSESRTGGVFGGGPPTNTPPSRTGGIMGGQPTNAASSRTGGLMGGQPTNTPSRTGGLTGGGQSSNTGTPPVSRGNTRRGRRDTRTRPAASFVVPLNSPRNQNSNRTQTNPPANTGAAAAEPSTSTATQAGQAAEPNADPPGITRSRTFVRDDGPETSSENVPRVGTNSVAYSISLDESLGDINDDSNTVNFRFSTGDSVTVARPFNSYSAKGPVLTRIGGERSNAPGSFTWPRGVAVSPLDGSIVVADSSNHRVQVFDSQGRFLKQFGSYGQADGEFDCLAGVAVNTMGQIIISDRYNNRIQVFSRNGVFSHKFGSEGTGEGQLNYPWGIATDNTGFIYVCDKENHRIQVFQQDGTFVRKFGSLGNDPGQFEHPHYCAVSENKIIVSDSNNHRLQVLTTAGQHINTFGSEGGRNGQLKYPRGVAVDRQGFIIVGDSGNSRVQIFRGDGRYYSSFGTWGTASGQMKGLEGIAVTQQGKIIVSDKENHRIQIF